MEWRTCLLSLVELEMEKTSIISIELSVNSIYKANQSGNYLVANMELALGIGYLESTATHLGMVTVVNVVLKSQQIEIIDHEFTVYWMRNSELKLKMLLILKVTWLWTELAWWTVEWAGLRIEWIWRCVTWNSVNWVNVWWLIRCLA